METKILPNYTVSDLINNELRDYSLYVVKNRGLPSFVDGMKSTARKLFWLMSMNKGEIRVSSLSGRAADKANYHHGDCSGSVVTMTQKFPGSNNIPLFVGRGEFGSVQNKNSAASRYIYCKYNPLMNYIYLDKELHKRAIDIEDPEPLYFYPIIPMLLVNSTQGIATGHACKFQSFNIHDIISLVEDIINDVPIEDITTLTPYFNGYNGDILYNDEKNRWDMYGAWHQVNTSTLRITELPITYTRESYIKFLLALKTKRIISNYIEEKIPKGQNWNIIIKLPRNSKAWDDPNRVLGLRRTLSMNMSCISEDDKVIKFDFPEEIAIRFVYFRLKIYEERIIYKINKIKNDIEQNKRKIDFVKLMSNLDFKNMTAKEVRAYCISKGFDNIDELSKLLKLPISMLNSSGIETFQKKINELEIDLDYYNDITAKELYKIDLENLKNKL